MEDGKIGPWKGVIGDTGYRRFLKIDTRYCPGKIDTLGP